MPKLHPAERYAPTDDLWLVTSYFNPCKYSTRRRNFEIFQRSLQHSGLRCLTVECAFGDTPFELPGSEGVLQVRCRDVLWQKERLLNLAIANLPPSCTKVAWLDCDILFENPLWAVETSRLLDSVPVVQPFDRAYWLRPGESSHAGNGTVYDGFAAKIGREPAALRQGNFNRHGHTGFAWAARRELLLKHGLYDVCLAGTGDHLMAHAMFGDWTSPCVRRMVGAATPLADSFAAWSARLNDDVAGQVRSVEGGVLHLWHGEHVNRRYWDRNKELIKLGFDPKVDIEIDLNGGWCWRSDKPTLHRWAAVYFDGRREDTASDSTNT
jgi:hypothetical protein